MKVKVFVLTIDEYRFSPITSVHGNLADLYKALVKFKNDERPDYNGTVDQFF